MATIRTLAPGVYLRGDDQIQIKFSSKRLGCRITTSYAIPKYTKAEKDRAQALRGQLTAAADAPGTDDPLLIEHLDQIWLDRLGISRAQDLTLRQAVDRHMAMYDTAGKNTRTSAQRECNALLEHWGEEKHLSTFANEYTLIREWVLRNQSPSWRKKTGGRLKMLLEEIRRDGVIDQHPLESNTWWRDMQPTRTDRASKFKAAMAPAAETKNETKAFTESEVTELLAVDVPRPDEMALIATGFATGMRIGELFALSAEDIDFDAGTIEVNFNWSSGEFGLPKFDKQRVIPLPAELEFLLRRQVKKYEGAPVSLTVELEGEKIEVSRTFLFRNTNNHGNTKRAKRIGGQDLLFNGNDLFRKHFWRPTLEKAGIRYLPPYSMRHTYATNMINVERMDYRDVAAFMGHADPEVTRKRYVQARDDDQLARIEKFNKAARG